jgi:hypothetical protein
MKKITLTIAALTTVSLSAFAQGQVGFVNALANGYVIESDASHTATSDTLYVQAPDFTAQLWALSGPTTTVPADVDSYGYISPLLLTTDGFSLVSGSTTIGSAGAFSATQNVNVPGTVSGNTVLAVVCWSGEWANLATAIANNAYVGALAFVNPVGPASPTPYQGDISTGWNSLLNSPLSAANSGNEDLILTSVPEPTSLALAGLGGFGMLMALRRKQA